MLRKNIEKSGNYSRMDIFDINRLKRKLNVNFFLGNECIQSKITTFSFRSNKVIIKRLLYHNYVDDIKKTHRLINVCGNNNCINISHFI